MGGACTANHKRLQYRRPRCTVHRPGGRCRTGYWGVGDRTKRWWTGRLRVLALGKRRRSGAAVSNFAVIEIKSPCTCTNYLLKFFRSIYLFYFMCIPIGTSTCKLACTRSRDNLRNVIIIILRVWTRTCVIFNDDLIGKKCVRQRSSNGAEKWSQDIRFDGELAIIKDDRVCRRNGKKPCQFFWWFWLID